MQDSAPAIQGPQTGAPASQATIEAPPLGLARAVVLLIGTGEHRPPSDLTPVPAVASSLADLRDVLVARCGVARGSVRVVDPASPEEFGNAIAWAVQQAGDRPLLFYYVGHGLVNADGSLHLASRGTRTDWDHTAFEYRMVRQYLGRSRAAIRIVMLDCCFSGRAADVLSPPDQLAPLTSIEGVCVLTSAGREELALAPAGARHTVFTGALIRLLAEGHPECSDPITLGSAVSYLERTLPAANYPQPRATFTERIGRLVLTDNPAHRDDSDLGALTADVAGIRGGRPTLRRLAPLLAPLVSALPGAALAAGATTAVFQRRLAWSPIGARAWLLGSMWSRLWLILGVAGVAALAAVWLTGRRWPPAWWPASWRPAGQRWVPGRRGRTRSAIAQAARRGLRWALPPLLAVALGGAVLQATGAGHAWAAGCTVPVHVNVLTTADSYQPTLELRDAFERDSGAADFGCPTARLHVYVAPRDEVVAALRTGWTDEALGKIGARPDVWLPDSSLQVDDVLAAPRPPGLPIAENRSVATSPMVLGLSGVTTQDSAQHLPATGASWGELFDGVRRLGGSPGSAGPSSAGSEPLAFNLIAPDPSTSVAGELARAGLHLADPKSGAPAAPERARDFDRYVLKARDRFGYRPGFTDMSLLCKLRADPPERTTRTAVVVSEQALARYNRGDPLSAECPGTAGIRPRQLGASYPSETGVLDHPFVRFDWPDLADRQVEAAARFGAWLGTVQGRRALREVGLRDRAFNQGGALSVDYGVLPGAEYHPVAVTADLRGRIRTAYRAAQRTGRVLLALDASGSLGLPADGNRRRWDVAVDGVLTALQRMGSRDEVGLWIFQGENAAGVHELVPIGPRDTPVGGKARGQAVADQLAGVQMGGRTPLYAAIIAGVAAVGPTTEDRATAVVVLTDGEDDNASRLTAQQFRDAVQGRGVQVSVIAIGDAQCSARALSSLTASTGGTCGEAGRSSAAPALATVLTSLWSG